MAASKAAFIKFTSESELSNQLICPLLWLYNEMSHTENLLSICFANISRHDDLKIGTLVGTDKYGNKYFENNYYFYGRNRWVEYAPHIHMAYDASQIPPEWFGWMHYKVSKIAH